MTKIRICLSIICLTACGCADDGSYHLRLVFEDDATQEAVSEVEIWVRDPGGHACQEFLSHLVDPADSGVVANMVVQVPPQSPATLREVPKGSLLFIAEGRDSDGARLLRGCTLQEVKAGTTVEVTLTLAQVCWPDPAGEDPATEDDDDCDGRVNECGSAGDCDDRESCTAEFCIDEQCQYSGFPDNSPCSDGDQCTSGDVCLSGTCTGQGKDCSAFEGPCQEGRCDPATGECGATPRQDGSVCDDGLHCTDPDYCSDGGCTGDPIDCDDSDPCTRDECNEGEDTCDNVLTPIPGTESSSVGDSCTNGQDDDCDRLIDDQDPNCQACQEDADCDDDNPCTSDACTGGACQNTPVMDATPCSDGLFCTVDDACQAGVCLASPRDCSALGDACNDGVCLEGDDRCDVQPRADGTSCEDGLYCTVGDACATGACLAGGDRDCDDDDFCTLDSCNEGLDHCDNVVQPVPGQEGLTVGDSCSNGVDDDCDDLTDTDDPNCQECSNPLDCWDSNPCTDDDCVDNQCQNDQLADQTGCDDGLYCTVDEACLSGACVGSARDCSAMEDQCNYGVCDDDLDECQAEPVTDGRDCDDGQYCSVNTTCDGGECSAGQARDCTYLSDQCSQGDCIESADECQTRPDNEDDVCNDNLYCTSGDICQAGMCTGTSRDCSGVADECNSGICDEELNICAQQPLADGIGCGSQFCKETELVRPVCESGSCSGEALSEECSLVPECNVGSCDAITGCSSQPVAAGIRCGGADFDFCNSECNDGGECVAAPPPNCDDGNFCDGVDYCATATGECQSPGNLPSNLYCDGSDLVDCDGAGNESFRINCAMGCNPVSEPAQCMQLDPSNLDPSLLCANSYDFVLSDSDWASIDGDTGEIHNVSPNNIVFTVVPQGAGLPEIAVFSFNSVTIERWGYLEGWGDRAIAIVACNDITIDGTVEVDAYQVYTGPGGYSGGAAWSDGDGPCGGTAAVDGDPSCPQLCIAGGGGGGHGGLGGDGGPIDYEPGPVVMAGGAGGGTCGTPTLIPLAGGSGGAGGARIVNMGTSLPGIGGHGGGALQLVARNHLSIQDDAKVLARAYGGGFEEAENAGGAGGGAGGGILLEAVTIEIMGFAYVTATGGGGGGGDCNTRGGDYGEMGEGGTWGGNRAQGGRGSHPTSEGTEFAGDGGDGSGASIVNGDPGTEDPDTGGASGGGGGGAGRIRINTYSGSAVIQSGTIIHPTDAQSDCTGLCTQGQISLW